MSTAFIGNFFDLIKRKFLLFFLFVKERKSYILKFLFVFSLSLLILFSSGYSGTEFFFSNRIIGILNVVLFVVCFLTFVLNINIKTAVSFFKNKEFKKVLKINYILLFLLFILLLVSCIINLKNNNTNGILRFLIVISSSLLIVFTIEMKTFSKYFTFILSFVCLISLFFFFLTYASSASLATEVVSTDKGTIVYSYFFISFLLRSGNQQSGILFRMSGPFWEPSIFALVICLGILFLILYRFKGWKVFLSIFLISLICTFSLGGFILLFLLCLVFLSEVLTKKNRKFFYIIIISSVFLIILILGPLLPTLKSLFPSIFGKIDFSSGSFFTRFSSIYYFFLVFLKSPIFGLGPNGALSEYAILTQGTIVDSATSTFGFYMASFGIFGCLFSLLILFSPLFLKKYSFSTRLLLVVFLFFSFNLQNVPFLCISYLCSFYFVKEAYFGNKYLSSSTINDEKVLSLFYRKGEDGSLFKNLNGSLLVKGFSLLIGLIAVPIYNRYFQDDNLYGAWLAIVSILSWTLLLDFGFGTGLRAKLSDAFEKNDVEAQKSLISSTYVGTFFLSLLLFLVCISLIWTLDMNSLLNISIETISSLNLRICMSILSFGLSFEFFIKNAVYILYALKKSAIGSSLGLISNSLLLLFFIIFPNVFGNDSFFAASIAYVVAINTPLLVSTFLLFSVSSKCKGLLKLRFFRRDACSSVLKIGIAYFAVQIGFLLIAQTDSFLISNIFSSSDVVEYTKYSKIFSFFIGLMGAVVQQPIWSAISASSLKKDVKAIKKYSKITFMISGVLFIFCLVSSLFLQTIFDIWLGDYSLQVNWNYIIAFIFYSFSFLFADALIIIANGLKIVKSQAIISILGACVKIAVVYAFCLNVTTPFGWSIIIIIDAICYIPFCLVLPIQIFKKNKTLVEDRKEI